MTPDIELNNELVATEIMGWRKDAAGYYFKQGKVLNYGTDRLFSGSFDPLHDLNHCMMVVEKMRELSKKNIISWEFHDVFYDGEHYWVAEIFDGAELLVSLGGNTLNEAILKAALLAKGVNLK